MKRKLWSASVAMLVGAGMIGCAGASAPAIPSTAAQPASAVAALANGGSGDASKAGVSLAALPLDDTHYTTAPKTGWIYSCQQSFMGQGPQTNGPWIDTASNTFDLLEKPAVEGTVGWNSELSEKLAGSLRNVDGNGLPSHTTGIYPISESDPAYQYDQNPNRIETQHVADAIPANPKVAKTASCLNMGPIGVMSSGAQLYNALDGLGRDAVAHEVLDKCSGHPDQSGTYHYHSLGACLKDPGTGHSQLLGYALDGFGIYGLRGTNGAKLTDADLDACHGHTHAIQWNGKTVTMYHYHMTQEFPYSLGCYRGTPIAAGPP
jgi:hypothetical protein